MNKILIASFDIGKKNFAFVIEEIYIDELKKLKPPKPGNRYTITGEPNTEFESFLPQLYTCGKIILVENLDLTQISDPKTILDSIEAASYAKVTEGRDEAREIRLSLESNIRDLQITIENQTSKSTKLDEMVEQLKSSYRLPEQWAVSQGKKEVLIGLTEICQETYLTKAIGDDLKVTRWALQRIENLLKKNGVLEFGQINSRTSYDSSLHEFIPGSEGIGKEISIKCLGFEWRDPAGNRIILSRAKVVPCPEGENGL